MHPQAVERSWWFNWEIGEISASWTEAKGNKINLRVFRKCLLTRERYAVVRAIKDHLDKRGTDVDENELRMVLHPEHEWMKREAEAEIIEYQHYHQGIPIGKKIRFYDLSPYNLFRLPVKHIGLRHLDEFPYNFGSRAVARDWLDFPPRTIKGKEAGNYLYIKEKGVQNMDRDELREHLRARGQTYERGELKRPALQDLLQASINEERARRKVHWFCCADDKCRKAAKAITFDPDADGHEMVDIGPSFIDSWDSSKGRKPVQVSVVYAHLREHHWSLLINRGYAKTVV